MSDLYLDLRRRIPVVAEWTDVGSEEMDAAQKRTGLSDERLAAQIHVSTKTWSRWKRRGQIPTHELRRVAPLLGFELVQPDLLPLAMESLPPDLQESLAVLVDLLRSVDQRLARIERAMPEPRVARARAGHSA